MTIEEQYQLTVKEHQDYVAKLEQAFNQHCDELTQQSAAKLSQIPPENPEGRNKIAGEHQQALNEALRQFKNEIILSENTTRAKLESLYRQRDNTALENMEKSLNF